MEQIHLALPPDDEPYQELLSTMETRSLSGKYVTYHPAKRDDDHNTASLCLVGNTLVHTLRGAIPIDQVLAGDYVLTRLGFSRVLASIMSNISASVYTVRFSNGITLTGTGTHPVWLYGYGWVPLRELVRHDTVLSLSCEEQLLWMDQCPHSYTSTTCDLDLMESIIEQMGLIERKVSKTYIKKYGNQLMVLFRRAMIFTTKMKIHSIMILTTLWQYLGGIIIRHMQKNIIRQERAQRLVHWLVIMLRSIGTRLKGGCTEVGCKRVVGTLVWKQYVNGVARYIASLLLKRVITVQYDAEAHVDGQSLYPMTSSASASYVESSFMSLVKARHKHAIECVPLQVEKIERDCPQPVYNLYVSKPHEYFANGILVHNCALVMAINALGNDNTGDKSDTGMGWVDMGDSHWKAPWDH